MKLAPVAAFLENKPETVPINPFPVIILNILSIAIPIATEAATNGPNIEQGLLLIPQQQR